MLLRGIVAARVLLALLAALLILPFAAFSSSVEPMQPMPLETRLQFREQVREMFYHGYNNYMKYAFPHDELKPLSGTWTNSLPELGGVPATPGSYDGLAMTLIDCLSTLAVLGDKQEFAKQVKWISKEIHFDHDVRINLFELNIRMLGGLVSAHALASDASLGLMPDYDGSLLRLAIDLGDRMMAAFDLSSTDIPYAWINLKYGVRKRETLETCTAGVGTLLLEMGMLSYYADDPKYFEAADAALIRLWRMRSDLCLMGNTLNVQSLRWNNQNSGIGAGIDSFYEYLMKSHVLFGSKKYLSMFDDAYRSVVKYLKSGQFYIEANMHSGSHSYEHFNSLSAFWPGLQVLVGDFDTAAATQEAIFDIWRTYGALPERYLISSKAPHSTENYYPLRPELLESTYLLYMGTGDPVYLEHGALFIKSINEHARVTKGFASIRNVQTKQLEDRMPSFFLAETVKYLYLLFDADNFIHKGNFVFTSEAHPLPVLSGAMKKFGVRSKYDRLEDVIADGVKASERRKDLAAAKCPVPDDSDIVPIVVASEFLAAVRRVVANERHSMCLRPAPRRGKSNGDRSDGSSGSDVSVVDDFEVGVEIGGFNIVRAGTEEVRIRNLGSPWIQIFDSKENHRRNHNRELVKMTVLTEEFVVVTEITIIAATAGRTIEMAGLAATFGKDSLNLDTLRERGAGIHSSTERMRLASPRNACRSIRNNIEGFVAFVDRGGCTFAQKMKMLRQAGAIGMVVGNNEQEMVMMGHDGITDDTELDMVGVMVRKQDGRHIKSACSTGVQGKSVRARAPKKCDVRIRTESKPLTSSTMRPSGAGTLSGTHTDFSYRSLGDWTLRIVNVEDAYNLHLLS